MTDCKCTQCDFARDFGEFQAFWCWLERLQREEHVVPAEQHERVGRICLVLLLHERKHQPADFPEGMLLIKVECLRLHTLGKRNDLCHAYSSPAAPRISASPSQLWASSRLPNLCSRSMNGAGLSPGGKS